MNDTYFENVSQIIFYTTLSKQKLGEYKDDWFFDKKIKNEKNRINISSENENDNKYNISIERRPHFCAFADEHTIKSKKSEEIIGNNIDINKEMETKNEKEKDKENNINIIKVSKNNEQNSNTPTSTSIKSDSEEINSEEDMK